MLVGSSAASFRKANIALESLLHTESMWAFHERVLSIITPKNVTSSTNSTLVSYLLMDLIFCVLSLFVPTDLSKIMLLLLQLIPMPNCTIDYENLNIY